MKTSTTWNYRTIAGRIMMGLVFTVMIGSMDISPAIAKNNKGGHDNGRSDNRGRGYDNGRSDNRGQGYDHNRGYYRNPYVRGRQVYRPYGSSYDYRGRVYAPPPVIYAPPAPPGISLFFPPIILHP